MNNLNNLNTLNYFAKQPTDSIYYAGTGASLDLNFAGNKSLMDRISGNNLVTFTRASSGTFVDSNGVLQTATTNLLLRSEEFDNASWTPLSVPAAVTANNAIAPNGTLTADLITGVSAAADQLQQVVTLLNSTVYTYSIYIKQNTTLLTRIGLFNATASTWMGAVDIAWAAGVPSTSSTIGSPSSISYVAVGDGWYRCSFTTTTTTASTQIHFHPDRNNTQASAWVWGAKLEQSATVGEYVPTTSTINSAPRFDHDPTTGESLGLLVEEQRTNLLLRSEEFGGGAWSKGGGTITANSITAPNGNLTADKFVEDTSIAFHEVRQSRTVTENTVVTFSIYIRSGERTLARVYGISSAQWSGGVSPSVTVNLNTGTVVSGTGSVSPSTNGFYRISITGTTANGVTSALLAAGPCLGDFDSFHTGDGTSGIYLWGAQLEAGAFPTSYIPTTTTAVTRNADLASITGTAFTSFYNQSEGAMFAEALVQEHTVATFSRIFSLDDVATTSFIALVRANNSRRWDYSVFANGTGQAIALNNGIFPSAGAVCKGAVIYKANDFTGATQGVLMNADTSGSVPTVNALGIGMQSNGLLQYNGTIRRLTYFPQRISNENLQRITQ